ncbi:MAG: hypothetical protein PHW52_03395 [Candidatus Pacebacteria bacterium]|nr:hypothetical protein [Candidatus Paceibacterota bacterium]
MKERTIIIGRISLIPLSAIGACCIVTYLLSLIGITANSISAVYANAAVGSLASFYAGYLILSAQMELSERK